MAVSDGEGGNATRRKDRARPPATSVGLLLIAATVVTAAAATSDSFEVNITAPLHHYDGPEGCSHSYDLVRPELLTLNVDVALNQQVDSVSVVILNRTSVLIPGCRNFCHQNMKCTVRCNVSDVPDTSVYIVKAATSDLGAKSQRTVCINARDVAQVSFIAGLPPDVWSADGSIELRFEADGYPRPISYELSCEGREPLSSLNGIFELAGLPKGTTECRAVANTSRRINRTEPLNIRIRVDTDKLLPGIAVGTDDRSIWNISTTDASNTTQNIFSVNINNSHSAAINYTNTATSFTDDSAATDNAVLIAGLLVSCTVLMLAGSVGFVVHVRHNRRETVASSDGGAASATEARLASSGSTETVAESAFFKFWQLCAPCFAPISIINNSHTNFNFFGNTYEIHGEVRTLVVSSLPCDGLTGSPVPNHGSTSSNVATPPQQDLNCTTDLGGWYDNPSLLQSTSHLDNELHEVDGGETALEQLGQDSTVDCQCGELAAAEAQTIHVDRQFHSLPRNTSPSAAMLSDDEKATVKSLMLRTAKDRSSVRMQSHDVGSRNRLPPHDCPQDKNVECDVRETIMD